METKIRKSGRIEQQKIREQADRREMEDHNLGGYSFDHEFSPESDFDCSTQAHPVKRARTAKKLEVAPSPDDACQVCHKTDSPEWILLCDECDSGYHW